MFMTGESADPDVRTLIIGFSAAAESAARLLVRQGQPKRSIFVIARGAEQALAAATLGLRSVTGIDTATIERRLPRGLNRVIVDVEDDALSEELIRRLASRVPGALIVARALLPGAVRRLIEAGAFQAFCDSSVAGRLLAATAFPAPNSPPVVFH
jgi:hypothetical protein